MKRRGEDGAALLSVLLLVAIIAIIAALALERTRLATRLSAQAVASGQAQAALDAALLAAAARMEQGMGPGEIIPVTIAEGRGEVRLIDGANCFNLNSLVTGSSEEDLAVRPVGVLQFRGLMQSLGVEPRAAQAIAAAAADWIDSDNRPEPGGAEDGYYAALSPGYLPPNRFMADPSELRAVRGVSVALYSTLRPWLCALPSADLAPLNVNMLSPRQAPLLAMLAPGRIDPAVAQAFLAARPAGGYADGQAFWRLPALAGLTPPPEVAQQVVVETRWFEAVARVEMGGVLAQTRALFDVREKPARLVRRRDGEGA